MKQKNNLIGLYNLKTDEHIGEMPLASKKQYYFNKDHITMFQKQLQQIVKMNLTGQQLKVLLYLISIAEMGNLTFMSQSKIGKEISISSNNMSTVIKKLTELNIIIKGEKTIGSVKSIRLNNQLLWRGKVKHYNEEINDPKIIVNTKNISKLKKS